jgi:dynactin 1
MNKEIDIGTQVLTKLGQGVVRYCGSTSFADGEWLGVELDEPNGKNDGTVNGVRYFSTKQGHGVFVRRLAVKIIGDNNAESAPFSPLQSPFHGGSGSPSPRTQFSATRKSDASNFEPDAKLADRQPFLPAPSSFAVESPFPNKAPAFSGSPQTSVSSISPARSSVESPAMTLGSPDVTTQSALAKQVESLRSKLKIMDAKRREDREKLEMSAKLAAINRRLTDKLKALHDDVQAFKAERTRMELDLESATLDKEVAEETLEKVRADAEQYRRELESMRQDNDKIRDMEEFYKHFDPKDESGQIAALQARAIALEDALLALRDESLQKEIDFQRQTEKRDQNSSYLTAKLNSVLAKLTEAEEANRHLQSQLDAVQDEGAMFELTSEIERLNENCGQLQSSIDELETLRALDEELIENYVSREKHYQSEIEYLDKTNKRISTEVEERNARTGVLEESVRKYQELVKSLEHDMEVLGSREAGQPGYESPQVFTDVSTPFHVRSLNLSLKLKAYELELTLEELEIAKCYVVGDELEKDSKSIRTLLLLERIGREASILRELFENRKDNLKISTETCIILIEIMLLSRQTANVFRFSTQEDFRSLSRLNELVESVQQNFSRNVMLVLSGDLNDGDCLDSCKDAAASLRALNKEVADAQINVVSDVVVLASDTAKSLLTLFKSLPSSESPTTEIVAYVVHILRDVIKTTHDVLSETGCDEACSRGSKSCLIALREEDFTRFVCTRRSLASLLDLATAIYDESPTYLTSIGLLSMSEVKQHLEKTIGREVQLLKEIELADKEFSVKTPPWLVRAREQDEASNRQEIIKDQLKKLLDDNKTLSFALKQREKSIDELNVKIAILSGKQAKAKDQDTTIQELKSQLQDTLDKEKALRSSLHSLQEISEKQETLIAKLKKSELPGIGSKSIFGVHGLSPLTVEREIYVLQSTVEYLLRQNSRLKQPVFLSAQSVMW